MRDFTPERTPNSESLASNWAPDLVLIFALVGICLTIFVVIALLTPTILTANRWGIDSFYWRPTHITNSPDKKHDILVSSKIDFPVTDILDPTSKIAVELKNAETSEDMNRVEFGVYDICDLENLTEVEWKDDKVIVRKKYNQKDGEFEFALKRLGE